MKKTIAMLSLISLPAFAQQPQMPQMPQMPDLETLFMKQFDTNNDGKVSKDEFMKPTEEQFAHMDSNHDGALDAAEVKAFNNEMQQRMQELQRQMQQHGIQMPGMPQR